MERIERASLCAVALGAALLITSSAAAECIRVEVCHVPPGGPGVFHTIAVCEHLLASHLAHGDVQGNCGSFGETLCDDGNPCTIDQLDETVPGSSRCRSEPAPTDCDDRNSCTADSCDPALGCRNEPLPGAACDDGRLCTAGDTCTGAGTCQGLVVAGCCESDAECDAGACARETCNLATNQCEGNPVLCETANLCAASACDPSDGSCVEAPTVCPAGEACDPATGSCEQCSASSACIDECVANTVAFCSNSANYEICVERFLLCLSSGYSDSLCCEPLCVPEFCYGD